MSQTDPGSRGHSAPDDEPQDSGTTHGRKRDFSDFSDRIARARETSGRQSPTETAVAQCQAIAVSTSQQCQHDALSGIRYCADHIELVDDLFTPGE
ncbi:hypothetical protein [Haloarcula amylolytica]|uniref:hypothetical protein n=1 Tax=Haloarcula amylolytica TaxID=396317 RepID=UPI003C72B2F3